MDEVMARTIDSLRSHLRLLQDGRDLDPTANLSEYGLDSMRGMDILLDLESTFEITFPDAMLNETTLATLASLSDAVNRVLKDQE